MGVFTFSNCINGTKSHKASQLENMESKSTMMQLPKFRSQSRTSPLKCPILEDYCHFHYAQHNDLAYYILLLHKMYCISIDEKVFRNYHCFGESSVFNNVYHDLDLESLSERDYL